MSKMQFTHRNFRCSCTDLTTPSIDRNVNAWAMQSGNHYTPINACIQLLFVNREKKADLIASETEEEIFRILGKWSCLPLSDLRSFLTEINTYSSFCFWLVDVSSCTGVPWQKPHERVRAMPKRTWVYSRNLSMDDSAYFYAIFMYSNPSIV